MANRRIEYVFGSSRPSTGHSLGITTMALTPDISLLQNNYGTLFTGGRDGRINAWGLSPVQTPQQGTPAARVSDIHTNWVSDVQVFSNDSVVSCSADTTVKVWNVATNDIATIGHHTDYAQCLAKLSQDTVVSGGLDERILGWNVNRPSINGSTGGSTPQFEINAGHSIYAIATAPPNLVIGGSSDGAVRIWDTRCSLSQYIAKFTGHTDGVRSLFVANGDTVVSGSSDATVRVWSLRSGRLFKSMNQFHSSIWSLQPWNQGFLAGDRDGNIYHSRMLESEPEILVEHAVREGGLKGVCPDPVTGNIWVGTPFSPDLRCINPQSGHEVTRMYGHKGLRKHRLMNDKRRALVVDTDNDVGMVDLISAKPLDFHRHIDLQSNENLDAKLDEILDEVNTMDVLDNWCQVQIKAGQICVALDHRSINNTEVYLDDLAKHVSLTSKTPLPTPHESPRSTPGTTPATSPLHSPVNSGFFRQGRSPLNSPAVSRVTSSQSLTEIARKEQRQQKVSRLGTGLGHAKFYDPDQETDEDDAQKMRSSVKNLKLNDSDKSPSPLAAAARAAASTPKTTTFTPNTEDETEEPADTETADDEIRINLGNFVLENLFRGVVSKLKQDYEEIPAPHANSAHAHSAAAGTDGSDSSSIGGTNPGDKAHPDGRERKRTKFFKMLGIGRKKEDEQAAAAASSAASVDNASEPASTGSGGASKVSAGKPNEQQLTHQQAKQKQQQQQNNEPDSSTFQEAWSRAVTNRSLQSADPDSPTPDCLSRRARLVVTETVPGAGAPTEIYSTTVGNLIHSKQEVDKIEKVLPGWVGDAILLGKLNLKQPTKIGFSVSPLEEGSLPELTPETTRLIAISMLRARKIMSYTVGQLQQQNVISSEAAKYLPEELISLKCLDTEVGPLTTLATLRTRIWRQGGDVAMKYSLKKQV